MIDRVEDEEMGPGIHIEPDKISVVQCCDEHGWLALCPCCGATMGNAPILPGILRRRRIGFDEIWIVVNQHLAWHASKVEEGRQIANRRDQLMVQGIERGEATPLIPPVLREDINKMNGEQS